MQNPIDVPLSFLKNLEKSRAIMEMTDKTKGKPNNSRMSNAMTEDLEPQEYLTEIPNQYHEPVSQPRMYNSAMIENSKLPDSVKKIMKDYPTQSPDMFMSDILPDISKVRMDLMEDDREPQPRMPKSVNELMANRQTAKPTNTNTNTNYSNDEHVKSIVREEMLRIFGESYIKQIKEDTVKQTLTTLRKKGLLK
jgi:hypothetical protein